MQCVKCGETLPERTGPGYPRSYCSQACKRAAEFEVRRINRHLERLESSRSDARTTAEHHPDMTTIGMVTVTQRVEAISAEIARTETRLHELLEARGEQP